MLGVAFKEWAAICSALASGRQTLILRKGGIAEEAGEFRPEHPRFWLYPTYFHEQRDGLKPEAATYFDEAERSQPPVGVLRLTHFCDVTSVHRITDLDRLLGLTDTHIWSEATIRQRFHYRTPGLYLLLVRVFATEVSEQIERPEYAGCKTWVQIEPPVPIGRTQAVLGEDAFSARQHDLLHRIGVLPAH